MQTMLAKCGLKDRKCSASSTILFVVAVLCAVLPLSIDQLTCAIGAAVAYALYQEYRGPARQAGKLLVQVDGAREQESRRATTLTSRPAPSLGAVAARRPSASAIMVEPLAKTSFVAEQLQSSFKALEIAGKASSEAPPAPPGLSLPKDSLDKEVDALLSIISPTPASDRMTKELARTVQQTIRPTFPEAEVVAFSSGDLTCSTSLGMSVPEVDLVVIIKADDLPGQLKGRLARTGGASTAKLDARKVQKSAIRACMDRLVSDGGFKFRRSAFRGPEPKITLLAPAAFAGRRSNTTTTPLMSSTSETARKFDEAAAIPVDLSVNTVTPQCSDAILRTSRRFDARAQGLIVLVKRWARDRGICHSAKGHLSPYAWSLLAAFYLQVAPAGDAAVLPPLQGVELGTSGFAFQQATPKSAPVQFAPAAGGVDYTSDKAAQRKSVITLFREFVIFYSKDFNWRSEAVSLQVGKRAAPDMKLPLHIVVSSAGVPTQVGPHIQDPFEATNNLGTSMTVEGFARVQEELARAVQLLDRSSPEPSLAELLEPWVYVEPEENETMGSTSKRGSITSEVSLSSW